MSDFRCELAMQAHYTKYRSKRKRNCHLNQTGAQWVEVIMFSLRRLLAASLLCVLTALSYTPTVLASQANSTNYGVSEVQFGSGGELHACSTTYCAKQSAGELTVGNTKSTNYQAQGGLNTEREPLLEVTASGGLYNFGDLSASTTASASTTFSVRSYLASGYNVYIDGTSPKTTTGHFLTPMASTDISRVGVEQFGINLRANTTPAVGANVTQVPSGVFSFGTPAAAYNTVNSYKYVAGDIIAGSTSSSGETDYTMSMIANVATTTASGAYGGRLVINVVPTF
jgi:hypothetical protein